MLKRQLQVQPLVLACVLAGLQAVVTMPPGIAGTGKDKAEGAAKSRTTSQTPAAVQDDKQELKRQLDEYVKAFARGDAPALARMWTEEGTLVDTSGREFKGRQEIERCFAEFFSQAGGQPLSIEMESLEFPSPEVAIEHGVARLSSASTPTMGRYTAVHLKRDGKWLMSSVTETHYTPVTNRAFLEELTWLVGRWRAATDTTGSDSSLKDGQGSGYRVNAEWAANKNFIVLTFSPRDGETAPEKEYIGWNPLSQRITSWHFAADGGWGTGEWTRSGDSWVVAARSVQPGGLIGHATYRLEKSGDNRLNWQSSGRTLDGIRLSDIAAVQLIRDTQ